MMIKVPYVKGMSVCSRSNWLIVPAHLSVGLAIKIKKIKNERHYVLGTSFNISILASSHLLKYLAKVTV